jgi:hypothetical protein
MLPSSFLNGYLYFFQLKQKRLEGLKALHTIIWSDLISSWIYAYEKVETIKSLDSAFTQCLEPKLFIPAPVKVSTLERF